MNKIRKLWWKFRIKSFFKNTQYSDIANLDSSKRRCFICLAADYGNLGDVAITYAQKKWLSETYPDFDIIEWPISRTIYGMRCLKKLVRSDDIITVVGGGNMGDLYFDIELCRLLIVKTFPNNEIISFPQTIIYSDSREANYLKRLSKGIYGRHKHLTLQARELKSYYTMMNLYPNVNIELKKDIVLTLDKRKPQMRRDGILLCLRNDKEKASSLFNINGIIEKRGLNNRKIYEYDTHIEKNNLSIKEREIELEKILDAFRKCELVITDRLHGMIFAYITGTAAVVLPNNNHKIAGCYDWIKNCGFISFHKL